MYLQYFTGFFLLINCVLSAKIVTDRSQNKNLLTSGINLNELNDLFQTREWKKCQFPIALDAKTGNQIVFKQFLQNHIEDEEIAFTEENFDETINQLYQLLGCKYVEVIWLFGTLARHMARSCQLFTDKFDYKECMEAFSTTIRKTQSTVREVVNILEIFTPSVGAEEKEDVPFENEIIEDDFDMISIGSLFSDTQSEENDSDEDFFIYKLEENINDTPLTSEELIEIYSKPKNIIKYYRFEIIDSFQSTTSIDTILEKLDESNNSAYKYVHTRCTPRKKMMSDSLRFLGKYKDSIEKTTIPKLTVEHFTNTLLKYCKSVTERYLTDTGLLELLLTKQK